MSRPQLNRLDNGRVEVAHGSHAFTQKRGEHANRPDLAFTIRSGDMDHPADNLNRRHFVNEYLAHATISRDRTGCDLTYVRSSTLRQNDASFAKLTFRNGGLTVSECLCDRCVLERGEA